MSTPMGVSQEQILAMLGEREVRIAILAQQLQATTNQLRAATEELKKVRSTNIASPPESPNGLPNPDARPRPNLSLVPPLSPSEPV